MREKVVTLVSMASRTSKGRSTSAKKKTSGSSRSRSSSARQNQVPANAFTRFVSTVWLSIAHALGGIVRSIGTARTDSDPQLRRDGGALLSPFWPDNCWGGVVQLEGHDRSGYYSLAAIGLARDAGRYFWAGGVAGSSAVFCAGVVRVS